jgi:uncharacterized protein DUF6537
MEINRRLVAVFAADVEGYSRLMGVDEVGTLKGLTERRAILDKAIADHRGRIANTAGDSVPAEFGSAVDAVQCAVAAQAALVEANAALPADKRINFRIGIHVGDVMIRAGDVPRLYTDGSFANKLSEKFDGDFTLKFSLAPPLLARRDKDTGHLLKKEYGAWMIHTFRLLARLKFLRGTAFDRFGYSAERQTERRLIDEYLALIDRRTQQLRSTFLC